MRLFTPDEGWTADASKLSGDVEKMLRPILKEYVDKGYSVRGIEYVLGQAVSVVCAQERIVRRNKRGNQ